MLKAEKVLSGKYSKIEKERLNKAYKLLYKATKQNPVTKYQVAREIGLNGERIGRDYANAVAVLVPVISNSQESGFRVAKTQEDEPDNLIKIFEILSRCEEMLYKVLPNFEFEKQCGVEFKVQENAVKNFLDAMKEKKIAQFKIN